MSRTLPSECAHGFVYDWNDFGCECGPHGSCLDPSAHRAAEHCPHGCNDPDPIPSDACLGEPTVEWCVTCQARTVVSRPIITHQGVVGSLRHCPSCAERDAAAALAEPQRADAG